MEVLTNSKLSNPVLLPNAQLMEMLEGDVKRNEKALQQMQQRKRKPRKSRFENRDWIQQHVLDYLKGTPCVNIPTAKLGELKARCMKKESVSSPIRKKRKAPSKGSSSPSSPKHASRSSKQAQKGCYALTEAETLQVLNFMPQEMVEIHLMVEDLHDRMSEAKQEEFLEMIRSYNTSVETTEKDSSNDVEEDEEEVVEDSIELLEKAGNDNDDDGLPAMKVKKER
ncbi:unnamed protein product [Pseudo-nitzschia multistriata]|uniref:DNA-directed RNA polymerase III subunit RPC9 n=1 Tax=Pseudo-nitzschia multistriata TaxID=183589 RepID=A0A448Z5J4_9STRA|nr:unnamed protein product [Pseudo-nitzschia multistriata]